ncbi:MAG TPA: hypothetical protein VGV18_01060 [Verrucomicrobiae bacterium]|nr:hypothetical protein [Verrucomicrobiae bacterium]
MRIASVLLLSISLASLTAIVHATPSPDEAALAQWIADRQFQNSALPGYGAIAQTEGPAAVGTDGQPYYDVSPYSADLAVLGLLKSRQPNAADVAAHWISWYFCHLNSRSAPDGVPYNHFYHPDGGSETTCVKPGDPFLCHYNDATDSAAATFFSVLWAAHQAGMSRALLNTPERKQQIEKLAGLILKLQQSDGLCWAKSDYRVKYLEDNSEVYGGLCALVNLEREVFRDTTRVMLYQIAAEHVQNGILSDLYDPKSQLFYMAKFENNDRPAPNLNIWYPDTQAQLWPVLFGVIAPNESRARAAAAAINEHWNSRAGADWASDPEHVNQGWVEAGHAYAALLMGETNRVRTYLQAVKRYKFNSESGKPEFKGPFGIDDAGWLLRILNGIQEP